MDFDYTPEQTALKREVTTFARNELNADLLENDQTGTFSRDKRL
jgi:hypothetical protein